MLHAGLVRCIGDIAARVPVAAARVHRGVFDAETLARESVQAPALLLTCLALRPGEYAGGDLHEYTAELTLYCIARDRLGNSRLEGVLDDIITPLLGLIPGQLWGGSPFASGASAASARTLYAATIDQQGLALWAVEWEQSVRLPRVRA